MPPNKAQPSQAASPAQFKAALRKAKRKNAVEAEINYLNITAMLDMMTIILVFLLKSMAASSASIPQSKDLALPTSILQTEPQQEGIAVIVTKSQILVGDNPDPVVVLPTRESLAQSGLDGKYKKAGINDLHIVPLANALLAARETDKQARMIKGLDPNTSEAIVIVDESTPYRLFFEVLYTLGQSSYGKYHLMVMSGKKKT